MPIVAILLRIVARIALARALTGAAARGRAPAGTVPAPGPAGRTGAATRWVAGRLGGAVDVARVVVHAIALAVLLAGTGTLVTAGTTLTTLGPRWVGITILALAAVTAVMAAIELRTTLRLRRQWRMRRSAEQLRRV